MSFKTSVQWYVHSRMLQSRIKFNEDIEFGHRNSSPLPSALKVLILLPSHIYFVYAIINFSCKYRSTFVQKITMNKDEIYFFLFAFVFKSIAFLPHCLLMPGIFMESTPLFLHRCGQIKGCYLQSVARRVNIVVTFGFLPQHFGRLQRPKNAILSLCDSMTVG